ncbi:MAG: SusC/RagA family TonB-linked outer membrane protein [Mucilaginibacter sp.]|nr:SusC/RagA family TonB-linked outer membrane protein [Mucilaginibacter sp.]
MVNDQIHLKINKEIMRRIILFFQIILIMGPLTLLAQGHTITGSVRDLGGSLPGASVVEKGLLSNGTITDVNGHFKLTLKGSSDILVIRFIGYVTREVNVAGKLSIDINLQANSNGLDEVTVVSFTPAKRITTTGASSTISGEEIRTVPTANVQNALTGRLPGFFSQQSSGQPGKDASDFYIRGVSSLNVNGNQPLILVDDIEYTYDQLQQINVNEIESITILKDASTTAIYGIKGANGVLVVTTRRGKAGAPKINLRVEGGLQNPTLTPKFLDSYQSAVLINEAEKNDGLVPAFTKNDLTLFQNGTDPYGHPNTDWYNQIFKKFSYQANTNLDISGGTTAIKYFISGGALTQNGLNRDFQDPTDQVNTNYYFKRYNFRSNLDLQANKTLNLRLDVTTRFSDLNQPGSENAINGIYNFAQETPFSAPFLNPNGSFAYNYSKFTPGALPTLNARLSGDGYEHFRRTDYNVLFGAVQKLDNITPGLSVTARIAYASTDEFQKGVTNFGNYPSYHYDPTTNTYSLKPNAPYVFGTYLYQGNTDIYNTNVNIQLFSNYDRTFGKNHFTGLLLLNQQSYTQYASVDNNGSNNLAPGDVGVPQKFRGISAKAAYDYNGIYLVDFNVAYNGSDRFAASHQYGLFPAVGLGYNMAKEKYFKDAFPTFSLFKIRGSFGLVGSDAAPGNRYVYSQTYNSGGGYNFGESQQLYPTISEGALSNNNVVWEKSRKLDIGLDMNLLKDHISATIDVFHDVRYDQLITPGSITGVLGVGLPAINLGRVQNQGFDGQISYHNTIGNVQYNTSFVFSYAKNKILYQDEASPAYPWLAKTGHPIGQPFGYHYLGYYTAANITAETSYRAAHNGSNAGDPIAIPDNGLPIQAGDLRYQDLNGDGVINVFDQRAIGNPNLPNTTLGFSLGAVYKGFSINVLFQGAFNYSFILTGTAIEPFQSQFQPIDLQRWTPATAGSAQFPRLTSVPGTVDSPSAYPSDYWLVNAYYIRLKTLDVGYQFPTKLLPFHINSARIYMSAYNLLTFDNYRKYQQDPEVQTNSAGDAYINQRVINLGVQVGF